MQLHSVAIYCASSNKIRPSYIDAAERLGAEFAKHGLRLIYGDGGIGLMAAAARGALSEGGEVIGVIPQFMVDQGWNNPNSTQTIITQTMHERKATICDMADAMVALPGGIGTFEELLECLTWKQLGLHNCPVVILNTDGYYDRLLSCIEYMIEEQMMRPIHRDMFTVVSQPEDVIQAILSSPKWDPNTRRLAAI
ncbi:MAG: TIGR00730 family Rossman fold protein [Paludibacteraceae bacterium]|nr:TIGR00730 family Rossman fold protein [Paludibacteraceae bacterium]MBQ8386820.1 TIGR00730 family Rossman fold protein [Paludibacteraceae bacterium]